MITFVYRSNIDHSHHLKGRSMLSHILQSCRQALGHVRPSILVSELANILACTPPQSLHIIIDRCLCKVHQTGCILLQCSSIDGAIRRYQSCQLTVDLSDGCCHSNNTLHCITDRAGCCSSSFLCRTAHSSNIVSSWTACHIIAVLQATVLHR